MNVAARFYIASFENKNPDFQTNGELAIWHRLEGLNMNVVLDVGANVGEWSIAVSKYSGNAKIYAFEPIESTFSILCKHISGSRIEAMNIALSDSNQVLSLHHDEGKSFLSSVIMAKAGSDGTLVQTNAYKGDDWCEKMGVGRIGFLKIDTEGHDLKVLRGFEKKLGKRDIRLIQFEYGPFSIETKDLLKDFYEYLLNFGYVIGKIYPSHIDFRPYHLHSENFVLSNFVACLHDDFELLKRLKSN